MELNDNPENDWFSGGNKRIYLWFEVFLISCWEERTSKTWDVEKPVHVCSIYIELIVSYELILHFLVFLVRSLTLFVMVSDWLSWLSVSLLWELWLLVVGFMLWSIIRERRASSSISSWSLPGTIFPRLIILCFPEVRWLCVSRQAAHQQAQLTCLPVLWALWLWLVPIDRVRPFFSPISF
jgi:hypothetical protein